MGGQTFNPDNAPVVTETVVETIETISPVETPASETESAG